MTPITLTHGLPIAPDAKTAVTKLDPSGTSSDAKKPDPKLAKMAQEFEAIFLRTLLKPLEKAGEFGKSEGSGGGTVTSGSGVYGSMMVGALADTASSGGGIGLAHMVLEAFTRSAAAKSQK